MALTEPQRIQLQKQLRAHRRDKHSVNIILDKDQILRHFWIYPNVLRPDRMSSLYLARYLYFNNGLYLKRTALDMGCGSGLQGIIAARYGARRVLFTDIMREAIENTKANISQFDIKKRSYVQRADLFEKIKARFDLIIFNHPFFPSKPDRSVPLTLTMLDAGRLIRRFLTEAPRFLTPRGSILMPYYDIAGRTNHPLYRGREYGYKVELCFQQKIGTGLQPGITSIFKLRLR